MAACKINLAQMIADEAQRQGVDPGVALAVARAESTFCHWWPNGAVKVSNKGAIGVMQVLPSTAPGVDLYDVEQNIRAGVGYLREMYAKYGDWSLAVAAYNWGPGKVDTARRRNTAFPAEVDAYVRNVLGVGTVYAAARAKAANQQTTAAIFSSSTTGTKIPPTTIAMAAVGAVAIGLVVLS